VQYSGRVHIAIGRQPHATLSLGNDHRLYLYCNVVMAGYQLRATGVSYNNDALIRGRDTPAVTVKHL